MGGAGFFPGMYGAMRAILQHYQPQLPPTPYAPFDAGQDVLKVGGASSPGKGKKEACLGCGLRRPALGVGLSAGWVVHAQRAPAGHCAAHMSLCAPPHCAAGRPCLGRWCCLLKLIMIRPAVPALPGPHRASSRLRWRGHTAVWVGLLVLRGKAASALRLTARGSVWHGAPTWIDMGGMDGAPTCSVWRFACTGLQGQPPALATHPLRLRCLQCATC